MLVETIYTFIIVFTALAVSIKARKFYALSSYKAIKYFSNAFLSFAVAFFTRFILLISTIIQTFWIRSITGTVLSLLFYYTLSLAGFYLLYSLVWKNFKGIFLHKTSGKKEVLLHIAALGIAFITFFLQRMSLLFITQLIVLAYAISISYNNYKKAKKRSFPQLYFIAMVLAFIGYLSNYLLGFIEPFYPPSVLYVYAVTASIFIIFFYGAFFRKIMQHG